MRLAVAAGTGLHATESMTKWSRRCGRCAGIKPGRENTFCHQDKLVDSWKQVSGMFFLVSSCSRQLGH